MGPARNNGKGVRVSGWGGRAASLVSERGSRLGIGGAKKNRIGRIKEPMAASTITRVRQENERGHVVV